MIVPQLSHGRNLIYIFYGVKNSQILDLCSMITNRRQIDEKQPT